MCDRSKFNSGLIFFNLSSQIKVVEKVVNGACTKRRFFSFANCPTLPNSMLEYNRRITHTAQTVTFFLTLGQGRGEEGKKKEAKSR